MLNLISRIEAAFASVLRVMLVVATVIIFVFTLGAVSERYLYGTGFNSHAEIGGIALVWATFLGFALAYRARMNIRVDIIDGFVPRRLVVMRDVGGDLLALVIFGVVQWKIWRLIAVGGGQTIVGTPFSLTTVYISLAVTSGYAILLSLLRIISIIAGRGAYPKSKSC